MLGQFLDPLADKLFVLGVLVFLSARGRVAEWYRGTADAVLQNMTVIDRAADDIVSIMDHLKLDTAHIVGLSMGGFATLHFGIRHPKRGRSLVVAGCGYGAEKEQAAKFKGEAAIVSKTLLGEGMKAFAEKYAYGPTRVQFENKDPRGFAQFKAELGEHSALGSANTQIGVQGERPSLYDLVEDMRRLTVPTLVLTGDEDWPCLAPSVLMKREIPSAALSVMPNCGHTINLEDPDQFNRIVGDFIGQVEAGRWPKRDQIGRAHV